MSKKLVLVNDDGHGGFWGNYFTSPEDIRTRLESLRDSTVDIYEWCVNLGTKVNFISENFELFGTGGTPDFKNATAGDKRAAEHLLFGFVKKGFDPFNVVIDKIHDMGIKCHASIRMNPDYSPDWMGEWLPQSFNDSFYFSHLPRLQIIERDGAYSKSMHLSYAYDEFRERKLLLVKELCQRNIDGLNLDFLRHPPFLGYEPPTVERFIIEYGIDPVSLPEDDPRWVRVKCNFMTDFMRKVRDIAEDKVISVRINHRDHAYQGQDVETWIEEKLIDILIVSDYSSFGGFHIDLAPFIKWREKYGHVKIVFGEEACVAGEDITPQEEKSAQSGQKVQLQMMMSIKQHCKRALEWYSSGADGVHIFNTPFDYELYQVIGNPEKCMEVVKRETSDAPVHPKIYEDLGYV